MLRDLLNRLEMAAGLDAVGDRLQKGVQSTLTSPRLRDTLHATADQEVSKTAA